MHVQSGGVQRRRHFVWHAVEDSTIRRFPVQRWRWERTLKRSVGRTRSPAQTASVERSGGPSPCPVASHRARRHRHVPTPAPAIQPHEAQRPRQRTAAARRHPALPGVIRRVLAAGVPAAGTHRRRCNSSGSGRTRRRPAARSCRRGADAGAAWRRSEPARRRRPDGRGGHGLEAIQVDHRAAGRHRHRAVAGPPIAGAPESTTVQERSEIVLVKHVLRLFQRPLQTRDALHDDRPPMSSLGIGMHEGLCGVRKRASA